GNSLDNRKANLRSATRQQNCWNSSKRRTGLSKYKGVSRNKRGREWKAMLTVNGKTTYLGSFHDQKQAAKAYDAAAKKYYREFAALNFPP
ncbi:MAG: AP2 domain-containing protein, partial [Planctomycetota bacterium]